MIRKCALLLLAVLLLLPASVRAQATTAAPRPNGDLLFAADFNDGSDLEAAFGAEYMTFAASNGIATISSPTPGVVLTAMLAGRSFEDFIAEVDLLPGVEPARTQMGILFRADGPPDIDVNAHSLFVDPDNDVLGLDTLIAGGRAEDIVHHGTVALSTLAWNNMAANRLRVEAVGDTITIFLNGMFALQTNAASLRTGGMGLTLATPEDLAAGAVAMAHFANLRIYAVNVATAVPAATSTSLAPPSAAMPLPAAPVAGVPRPNGDLLFVTSFNDPVEASGLFDSTSVGFTVRDGVGTLSSTQPFGFMGARLLDRTFDDFIAEVSVTWQGKSDDIPFGLFFRGADTLDMQNAFYYLALSPSSGVLQLIFNAGDDRAFTRIGSTTISASALQPALMNRLRLEAIGNTFTVFLNGEFAFRGTSTERTTGTLGFAVGPGLNASAEQPVHVDFDLLTIFAPGPAAVTAAPTLQPTPTPTVPTATPAATLTPTPRAAANADAGIGVITSAALRVHDGPGADAPVTAMLAQNDYVFVEARDSACEWLQVMGLNAKGWVSSHYVAFAQGTCDDIPVFVRAAAPTPVVVAPPTATRTPLPAGTPTSTAVPTRRPAATPTVAPTARPVAAVPTMRPGMVTNFEAFGTWRRGDESWGTFTQSNEQVEGGLWAAKLEYNFPANVANGRNYVVFSQEWPIADGSDRLTIKVYGDNSGNYLNAWVVDNGGQVWQFTFGRIHHTGWRTLTAQLDTALPWPTGIVSGGDGEQRLDFPIRLRALVLDNPTDDASAGVIYLDTLAAK